MSAPRTVMKPFRLAAVLAGAVGWFGWFGAAGGPEFIFGPLFTLSVLGAITLSIVGVVRLARSADALRAEAARAAEREHASTD